MAGQNARCPYGDLHIYYLKGRVKPERLPFNETFLGHWQEAQDAFLFYTRPAGGTVCELLRNQPDLVLQDQFRMPYEQWQGGAQWPLKVGPLCILPPWHPEARQAENCILLDPGLVFGTGSHPTTRDCLSALALAFRNRPLKSVLDLGTGTGLLALAAARLGARRVLAVDLNRLAVQTARRNVRRNGLTRTILVVQGDAKNFIDLSFDLVVSNIHYAVMRDLVRQPGFSRHKQFILSGLLRTEALDIAHILRQKTVQILRKWDQDGIWHTFYGNNGTQPPVRHPTHHQEGP